jgi:hypothetical protein
MGGVTGLAEVCADAMDGFAFSIGISDFPGGPIIHLRTINPGHDVVAFI